MTERDRYGLRGPVMAVKTETVTPDGLSVTEYTFDREGKLLSSRGKSADGPEWSTLHGSERSNLQRQMSEDGTTTETQTLDGLSAWSSEVLNGCGFGTWGASIARTTSNAAGAPSQTLLIDARGHVVSRIEYTCDANGRVLEATQSMGATMPPFGTMLSAAAEAVGATVTGPLQILEPGTEQFRVRFEYDEAGRVTTSEEFFAGQAVTRTGWKYNSHSDVEESVCESDAGRGFSKLEYEYDDHGNWVHQTVTSVGIDAPPAVFTRVIAYFQ